MSHESFANVSRHSRDIRATFVRHSHDVRPMKLRVFITVDRLTTFSRTSCDCRTMVLREMINQQQALKLQTREVLRCWKEGARLLEFKCHAAGCVGLLNGNKY